MTPELEENLRDELGGAGHHRCIDIANEALDAVAALRKEFIGCSDHHPMPWQQPSWAKTRADNRNATNDQHNGLMATCHQEDVDPDDKCLSCYAYGVLCEREEQEKGE